jgi:hypothetical protein
MRRMEFGPSDNLLPLDPAERRRLWHEWIHADAPAGDQAARPRRRASDRSGRGVESSVDPVTRRRSAMGHSALPLDRDAVRRAAPFDRTEADGDWLADVLGNRPAGVVEGLSAAVRESLVGTELPASDRERLLRRAGVLGLNRFEANLLIAAVQHRARRAIGVPTLLIDAPHPIGVARLVAWVVALETLAAAVLAAWWLR